MKKVIMTLEKIKTKVEGLDMDDFSKFYGEPEESIKENVSKALFLLVNNFQDSSLSPEEIFTKEVTFMQEDGGYDFYPNVKNFVDIAQAQLDNDTDNDETGSDGYIRGFIAKEWVPFVDVNLLAKSLETSDSIMADFELEVAVRIW